MYCAKYILNKWTLYHILTKDGGTSENVLVLYRRYREGRLEKIKQDFLSFYNSSGRDLFSPPPPPGLVAAASPGMVGFTYEKKTENLFLD